jgi:hypothetical protein
VTARKLKEPVRFAFIRFEGAATVEIEYDRGVTAVEPTGTDGEYDVTFDRDVAGCVAHATPAAAASVSGESFTPSFVGVILDPNDNPGVRDDRVRAQFYNSNGNPVDTSFVVSLIC